MDKNNSWDKFEHSGKIADYMAYTAGMANATQDVKQAATKTLLDNSVKVNLPEQMLTGDMNNANKNTGLHIKTT